MEHVSCNICGVDKASPYCRVGDFQIVRCSECGLFYTSPRRSKKEASEIYSESYFTSQNPSKLGYDDYSSHAEGLRQVACDNMDIIKKFASPPGSLIDIGCAFGYFLQVASSHGWTVEGVEISSYASEKARENAKASVHTGDFVDLALPAASFNVATMWDVLEHSFDPVGDLAETNRILKPGGYLFMTVPNAGSLIARLMGRHWFGFKSAAEHNYFFSEGTIDHALSRSGFRLTGIKRGTWPCSMRFLATKLGPYSHIASRMTSRAISALGLEKTIIKFKYIDMLVIARKEDNPS